MRKAANSKRIIGMALAICLMCGTLGGLAEVGPFSRTDDPGDFVVGATSKLTGAFFTSMWGDNTSDIDVRSMIHGYSPVYWSIQPGYTPDSNVVVSLQQAMKDDGSKMYIVQLYDDLRFSDGTPITAYEYAFSYMLCAAPEMEAIGGAANITEYIKGYDEYHSGVSKVFSGVRVFDELTFGVEIKPEYLPYFYDVGYLDTYPYPISVIAPGCEVADDGEGAYIRNSDPQNPAPVFTPDLLRQTILDPHTGYLSHPSVTSGPYTLVSYDADAGVARFAMNPYFMGNWNGAVPSINNVVMKPVVPETMMSELRSGSVHLLNKVVAAGNIDEGMEMVAQGIASTLSYPRLGFGFIHFTCDRGVFSSTLVRQAVGYLVDTPALTRDFTKDYAITTFGYYGVGQWMFQALQGVLDDYILESHENAADWDALTAEFFTLNEYPFSLDQAKRLLIEDGWTLNISGGDYVDGRDVIRCKVIEGALTPLSIRWGKLKDSIAAEILHGLIAKPFMDAGILLDIEPLAYTDLIDYFYRVHDYTYDMLYLSTNFVSIFDPAPTFSTNEAHVGIVNMSGYRDAELEALALDMRRTEPGDLYGYEKKWVAFQKSFNEKLPLLPLYSNIYFDFHTPRLTGYYPDMEMSFPMALLSASYSDWQPVAGAAMEEGDVIIF